MKRALVIGCLLTAVFACHQTAEESDVKRPGEIHNPNGDSELALVMRHLHYEAAKVRDGLAAGEDPDLSELKSLAARIATAEPTPGNHFDSSFYLFSSTIESHINGLQNAPDKKLEFNAIINTCVSCHQTTCPGPIKKIRKLTLAGF